MPRECAVFEIEPVCWQINRHPTVTWTLPPGVKSRVVEIATDPATIPDGHFVRDAAIDGLEDAQTNWVYNSQLDPGMYYVHVGGFDEDCSHAMACAPFLSSRRS
jgi:hypothetical protein